MVTTADWSPGIYVLNVIVTHGDGRSYVAHESQIAVRQNPGAETPSLSAFEQQLVKIDEAITAIGAGQGVQSYAITTAAGTRQIQRMSLEDLRKHRLWVEGKIDAERGRARHWLSAWKNSPALVFDDFGKGTFSGAVERHLFDLIDHRHTHMLPTIISANTHPQDLLLADAFSGDRGAPIVGRILETYGNPIVLSSPN